MTGLGRVDGFFRAWAMRKSGKPGPFLPRRDGRRLVRKQSLRRADLPG